jgi:uncharacterized protein YbbK (DUF523 family)
MKKAAPILVSACIAGIRCAYAGHDNFREQINLLLKHQEIVIVCPELLGGLPIPRSECRLSGGDGHAVLKGKAKVIGQDGKDYSRQFIEGAKKVLQIAKKYHCQVAYLKRRSPSCGAGKIYSKNMLVDGDGVTAALLKENNIEIHAI